MPIDPSRWMKARSSGPRIGPQFQATIPDLQEQQQLNQWAVPSYWLQEGGGSDSAGCDYTATHENVYKNTSAEVVGRLRLCGSSGTGGGSERQKMGPVTRKMRAVADNESKNKLSEFPEENQAAVHHVGLDESNICAGASSPVVGGEAEEPKTTIGAAWHFEKGYRDSTSGDDAGEETHQGRVTVQQKANADAEDCERVEQCVNLEETANWSIWGESLGRNGDLELKGTEGLPATQLRKHDRNVGVGIDVVKRIKQL